MSHVGSERTGIVPWAQCELGLSDLGDARRTKRLVRIVSAMEQRPTASLPEAAGSWSQTKAAYRFLSNGSVQPTAILKEHRTRTIDRLQGHSVVLCVQDTTSLNFDTENPAQGLGPVGNSTAQGLYLHSCLAVTPDGVPQGLLWWKAYARENGMKASQRRRKSIDVTPVEEKESYRWVEGVLETARVLPTGCRAVNVMDREGDAYEVFRAARNAGVDVLVRSCHSRRLADPQTPRYLWDEEARVPLAGVLDVHVPRKPGRAPRVARLHVRYAPRVQLRDPHTRVRRPEQFEVLEVSIVFANEENPPHGQEAIHWRLVTTLPVESFEASTRVIQWYSLRWRIEEFHLVLKSGCRIERLQLEDASRIRRALAMYAVVAWRLLFLNYEARARPEARAGAVFSTTEIAILSPAAKRARPRASAAGARNGGGESLSLHEAVRAVACLGGFLARRQDGEPGVRTLWKGLRALDEQVKGFEAASALLGKVERSG